MRFFRGGQPGPSSEEQQRAERSRQMVEAGGIPLEAEERIARQREPGAAFTSDLSVDELAALRQLGYRPLALVMGSSMYQIGWVQGGFSRLGGLGMGWAAPEPEENLPLTRALTEARHLALGRLMREAEGLGAEGVVGVRLLVRSWEWAQGMAEFTVLGTAVRREGGAPPARPFTSTLSGQDLAKLAATGQRPLGVALGASAWTAMAFFGGLMGGMAAWSNQEVSSFSRALHLAQHQSRARMAAEASALGGQGVVGVELESRVLEYQTGSEQVQGRIVQWVALGTVVTEGERAAAAPAPRLVVPLS
jgi:uncharacterized protein YbjQ (UPF0145 family)